MTTQTIITVLAIIAIAGTFLAGLIALNKKFGPEAQEKRFREKSNQIRTEVEKQTSDIRKRCLKDNISLGTEAGQELTKALATCDYLIRDGYRSTDAIEKMSAVLPELEKNARAASGAK